MSKSRVDIHTHLVPPFWAEELKSHGGDPSGQRLEVASTGCEVGRLGLVETLDDRNGRVLVLHGV